jgi:ABC-type branched-subunit amino acid transport system ATPase component
MSAAPAGSGDLILETRALTKEFKGFVAVDHVDLRVRRGTIHALIGPNGAGKTTCFNLLTKFLRPTSGTILYDGHDITAQSSVAIARMGVVRSFQISAVFNHLSVLENVRVRPAEEARDLVPLLEAGALAPGARRRGDRAAARRRSRQPTPRCRRWS